MTESLVFGRRGLISLEVACCPDMASLGRAKWSAKKTKKGSSSGHFIMHEVQKSWKEEKIKHTLILKGKYNFETNVEQGEL